MQDKAGQRVYLTTLAEKHIDRYLLLSDDPELVSTMGWQPFAAGERERFLKAAQVLTLPYCGTGKPIMFSIISTGDKRTIGYVCLKGINKDKAAAELGIAIMEKGYRNQGYGRDALKLALSYAFDRLGLALVGLTVFPSNRRALKAYERTGFRTREVLKDSWLLPNGEYTDMLLMEITRQEWQS